MQLCTESPQLDLSLAATTGSSIVGGDGCVVGMSSSRTGGGGKIAEEERTDR
jgi:hypothetical protein